MKQNSNTDILIERLKQNQYESELERRKDADALFAAGCAEDNDTWKSLALYYLASERITAQDEMTLDHLLGEDIRDKVTGLLMMRPFLHLADEGNKRRKEGKKYVLLFYNILNFARYNYRFGLDEGDRLLKRIGRILQDVFPDCLISHFDVDHYIVLFAGEGDPDLKVRESYERIFSALRLRNTMGCKIGAYVWDNPEVSAEAGCSHAKSACDSIHDINGEFFVYYSDQLQMKNEMDEYIRFHIDEAVEKGWLKVYYQPIIRTITGDLCSFEALSRWQDPIYGPLAPYQFIEPLEESGLIYKLDVFVLNEVCRRYDECRREGIRQVPVSFNLARQDFFAADIYQEVENAVQKYHVPRDFIQIEVTERVFADNDAAIETALNRFRRAGYAIWIDDFGSGYSTLNLLKDYDYDMLKIDMAFMLSDTDRSRRIVQSIVQMNDRLNGASLCEGVETKEQFAFLKSIGCDFVQGYYFSAPRPFEDVMAVLKKKKIRTETWQERIYYQAVNNIRFEDSRSFALVETDGRASKFLYASKAFRDELKAEHYSSLEQVETSLEDSRDILHMAGEKAIDAAIRRGKKTSFRFAVGDQLLKISMDLLNEDGDTKLFLVEAVNITAHNARDEEKRKALYANLFYLSDAIYEVNVADDVISQTVIVTGEEKHHTVAHGIEADKRRYCQNWIYPYDQARYLKFFNSENIMMQVREEHQHIFRGVFRTRRNDGSYSWKAHTLVYAPSCEKPAFLYTINPLQQEVNVIHQVEEKQQNSSGADHVYIDADGERFAKADVLDSIMGFVDVPLYLKDTHHRYVAVSRSFLKVFDLDDDSELIGRSDDELNWCYQEDNPDEAEDEVLHRGKHIMGLRRRTVIHGEEQSISMYMIPVYINGRIAGVAGSFAQDSMRRKWEGELQDTQQQDAISGVYNIRTLLSALASCDDMYRLQNEPYALVLCQIPIIEQMYALDDMTVAEKTQQAAAEALLSVCSHQCIIGQLSRAVFAILVRYHEKEEVVALTVRMKQAVSQIRSAGSRPVTLSSEQHIIYCDALNNSSDNILSAMILNMAASSSKVQICDVSETENRISTVMDDSLIAAYVVRPDRTIVYWNKAAQALTGYSRGWMCGRRCNETLLKHMDEAGNDLCRSKCPFLKVLETDQPAAQNAILHKRDGGTLKVRAVFTPIRDANGTAVEVLEQFYPLEEEVHP